MTENNFAPESSLNRFSAREQMNAWRLEEDLNRINVLAEDFASGLPTPVRSQATVEPHLEAGKVKPLFSIPENEPFRKFQCSAPTRIVPTPLDQLYRQSIDNAQANSGEIWDKESLHKSSISSTSQPLESILQKSETAAENGFATDGIAVESVAEPAAEHAAAEKSVIETPISSEINVSPLDMFRLPDVPVEVDSSLESEDAVFPVVVGLSSSVDRISAASSLNRSVSALESAANTESENKKSDSDSISIARQADKSTTKSDSLYTYSGLKQPLLSLSVSVLVCGLGLIIGALFFAKTTLINPGKALFISGVAGILTALCLQQIKKWGKLFLNKCSAVKTTHKSAETL